MKIPNRNRYGDRRRFYHGLSRDSLVHLSQQATNNIAFWLDDPIKGATSISYNIANRAGMRRALRRMNKP